MKKIIALAVASAFVAPAMAADVSVSGAVIYNYVMTDETAVDEMISSDDNNVKITASQDLDNGMSVKATFALVDDTSNGIDTQGTNLQVSHSQFGTLAMGDVSGALDATGDWTDVSPVFGGFRLDGGDHNFAYTLPTFVPGLTVIASMSPRGDNYTNDEIANATVATNNANNDGTLGAREGENASGVSLTYTAGAVSLYYGEEEFSQKGAAAEVTKHEAYGIKYSAGPLMVAYESGSATNADVSASAFQGPVLISDGDYDTTGIAVTYKMGSTTLGVETQELEATTASATKEKKVDETTLFVTQDLGNGVKVYAATTEDSLNGSTTAISRQAVGISFAF